MTDAERDQNHVTVTLGVSSDDGVTTLPLQVDPITGRLLADIPTGVGTVTSVSVVTANGFAGSVATATTTPAITLSTTLTTPVLAGNGTALIAATTTGSGSTVVLQTSPTLVTPLLGTPTSGNLANCTGFPVAQLSGLGTGVATALAINVGSAGAFVTFNGALGTPSSGTLTNATGLPSVAGTTGTLSIARGGTAKTAISALSIWVANSADTLVEVTPGAGNSIRVNAGGTAWEAYTPGAGGSGITIGTTTITSGTTTRILYNNAGVVGEYTLTGTGTVVAMQTAPSFLTSITTPSVLASSNDSGALGASGTAFSDLFLASGAVINFAAGNSVITHSSAVLTVSTGDLRVTTAGTDTASVVTVGGTQTLTNKTLTSPRIGTNILDTNGNELLVLTATASAVNELTLANAATAGNPTITVSGGDSNIGIDWVMKGTGTFNLRGNATQAAELRLYEDTDNGSNYSAFKVGTQAGNLTYTLPTAFGAAGSVLTDAAGDGTLSWSATSGGGNPGWDFVSYPTASASTDVTVSGLDLATDGCYKIILEMIESGTNEPATPFVRINGITTSTYNYMGSYNIFQSGSISTGLTSFGAAGTRAYLMSTGNPHSWSSEFIFNLLGVASGTKRVVGRHSSTGTSNTNDEMQTASGSFTETSQTNLTSVTFGDLSTTKNWKVWVFKAATS